MINQTFLILVLLALFTHTSNDVFGQPEPPPPMAVGSSKPISKGFRVYTWASGARYEGEWKNGTQHGLGTMHYEGGSVYDGFWKNGELNGEGTYTWPSGSVYEGNWKSGLKHGKGRMEWSKNLWYVGTWKNDKYHGKGTYHWEDGGE